MAAVERRDAVDVDRVRRRIARVDERPGLGKERARIDDPFDFQAKETSLAIQRELTREPGGASVMVTHDGLEARADPLYRLPQPLRGEHERAVLRVGLRADAEAAADVLRVDADALGGRARDRHEVRQHHRQALRGRVVIEGAARGVVSGDTSSTRVMCAARANASSAAFSSPYS